MNSRYLAPPALAVKAIYPLMRSFAALDAQLPFTQGYLMLATLERTVAIDA